MVSSIAAINATKIVKFAAFRTYGYNLDISSSIRFKRLGSHTLTLVSLLI